MLTFHKFNMQLHSTLSVQELFKNKLISRAAYTICVRAQFTNLGAIASYQSRFKNFLRLKACGDTTNEVLVSLCRRWAHASRQNQDISATEALPGRLTPAHRWYAQTREQQQHTENKLIILRSRLPKRTDAKLRTLCGGNPDAESLAKALSGHLSGAQHKLLSPVNLSGARLLKLVTEFTGFLEKPGSQKEVRASLLALLRVRMSALVPSHPSGPVGGFLKDYYSTIETGNFPLLAFVQLFFQHCLSVPAKPKDLFLQLGPWYATGEDEPAEATAARFGCTLKEARNLIYTERPERNLLRQLGEAVSVLRSFRFAVPPAFVLSREVYQRFSGVGEQAPFTDRFIISLILLLNPGYKAVRLHAQPGKCWAFFPEQVLKRFNVADFSAFFGKLLAKRTPAERVLTVASLIAPFCRAATAGSEEEAVDLVQIASLVLEDLYGLRPGGDGCVHLPPNRPKTISEHVYDIIKEKNQPCGAEELIAQLAAKGVHKRAEGIWGRLQGSRRFILMGSSLYGLKEWEESGEVGGTIKQIIIRYLEEAGEPRHLHDIAGWVMTHRNTSAASVRSNMQHDPLGWFRFFGNGFYGLRSKSYPEIRFNSIKYSWLHHVKKLYAEAATDRLPESAVADFITRHYRVMPVQTNQLLSKHISKGTFTRHGDCLVLSPGSP